MRSSIDDQVLYRSGVFISFAAGNSNQLVLPNPVGQPFVLSAETIMNLLQCRQFATLREHKERICINRGLSPEQAQEVDRGLRECVLHGLLLEKQDILPAEAKPEFIEGENAKVVSIGIPTRERIEKLEKSARSYARNLAEYARAVNIVIVDDSASLETRVRCRQMLGAVQKQYGVPILYAGHEEKRIYAEKLVEVLSGGRSEVEFSLFGSSECPCRPGANRNALLLDAAGDLFLSFDDDSACFFENRAESSGPKSLALSGDADPAEIRYLQGRDDAYARLGKQPGDVVAMHGAYLGKSLASVVNNAGNNGQIESGEMCGHLLKSLLEAKGAVIASFNGLIGDCGMNSRMSVSSLVKRGLQTSEQFQCAATCREMVRVVAKPTISHGSGWMNFASGLDNRNLLPPFMPIERSEDSVFVGLLQMLYRDGYFAHLPFALLHDAEFRSGYSNQGLYRSKLYDVVLACLHNTLAATVNPSNSSSALHSIGRHLVEAGSLDPPAFNELITVVLVRNASRALLEYQKLLRDPQLSPEITQLLQQEYQHLLDNTVAPDFTVPVEFAALRRDQAQEMTQRTIIQFGRLLMLWPEIVEAARQLKSAGERLAHVI